MGKYPLSPSEKARFDRMWSGLSGGKKATAVLDFEHFCNWLRGEDSSFYDAIKNKLRDLWNEVKSTIGDITEGAVLGVGGAVLAPVVGVYAGVKEGFENGVEAGVKEGFKAVGKFFDELLK